MGSGTSRPNLPASFGTKPLTKIDISHNEYDKVHPHYCFASMQGWRAKMEDFSIASVNFLPGYSYFAVLDGHAGAYPAHQGSLRLTDLLKDNLQPVHAARVFDLEAATTAIETAFYELDTQLRDEMVPTDPNEKRQRGGTTVTSVLVMPDRYLFINCGDSRVILSKAGALNFESKDHKPNNPEEVVRVQCAGGFVARGRVNGTLAVSRALGDFDYKPRPDVLQVSNVPDVVEVMRSTDDDFMVLASDGVWDVLRSRNAVINVGKALFKKNRKITSVTLRTACKGVVAKSFKDGSYDNITAMIVIAPEPATDAFETPDTQLNRSVTELSIEQQQLDDAFTTEGHTRMRRSLTITDDF
eukprot:m.264049 g.264049  ORF g.264049 m.264049 type:complete len:356 (+) comp53642_c0_seq1:332-1399(+)